MRQEQQKGKLDARFALTQVGKLGLLRGFPQNPEAIERLVEFLVEWCVGARRDGKILTPEQQCATLIDKALVRMRGWSSPAELKDVFDDLFTPQYQRYEPDWLNS
jgi:hypothetical protein